MNAPVPTWGDGIAMSIDDPSLAFLNAERQTAHNGLHEYLKGREVVGEGMNVGLMFVFQRDGLSFMTRSPDKARYRGLVS